VFIVGYLNVKHTDISCRTGNHNCLWEDNISDNEIDPVELKTITLEPGLPGIKLGFILIIIACIEKEF